MAPIYDALSQKYWKSFVFLKAEADSVSGCLLPFPRQLCFCSTPQAALARTSG